MGTAYNIYYLGVAADGTLGEIQTLEVYTAEPSYDSTATVTVTVAEANLYWSYDPADSYYTQYNSTYGEIAFNVEMSSDCASYMYAVIDSSYITNPIPSQYGNYIVKNTYYQKLSTDLDDVAYIPALTFWNSSYVLVIIPIDAEGNYGTPVITDYAEWNDDNATYIDPNADVSDDMGVVL